MKKLHILGVMLFAVIAFGAISASSAFALESGILASGAVPTAEFLFLAETGTKTETLYDLKLDAGVTCKVDAVFHVLTTTAFSLLEILEVTFSECAPSAKALNTKKEEVANACETVDAAGALNLPWTGNVEKMTNGEFLGLISKAATKEPGYLVECKTALGLVDDTCETNKGTNILTNVAGGLEAAFAATPETSELAKCSLGGAEAGQVNGAVLAPTNEEGLALTVSEE